MGNILFGESFDNGHSAKDESIINLSDQCIERITREDNTPADQMIHMELSHPADPSKLNDDRWMKILKCMDDVHTNTHDLTKHSIDELMEQVEVNIGKLRPQVCSTDELISCLKEHENCTIKCKKLMDEFIDCVDKSRIEIVKQKIEEENKFNKDAENETAKEVLSITEH